ncbi:hypothetical protein [Algivirga pacifica]|uniref:Uncharacterized protein n=1 Tax=Algivirga pacifica TaxID=1162670 RepID=A0ABP9D402_9BACT
MAENNKLTDFIENIEEHISNLINLEVKTIVSDYKVEGESTIVRKEAADEKVISSSINLLQGDVTTHVSESLIQDKYTWLREFHSRKEEQGHMIVENNIRAIYSLFELYTKTKEMRAGEEQSHANAQGM